MRPDVWTHGLLFAIGIALMVERCPGIYKE